MILEKLVVSPLSSNCYILGEGEAGTGVIIDPGWDAPLILRKVKEKRLKIELIVNTHCHFDHVGAVGETMKATGAPFLIHEEEKEMLASAKVRAKLFMSLDVDDPPAASGFVKDGEILNVGSLSLKVLFTPGHSPGGICILTGDTVFTGDTLFAGSVGRTDLPDGSWDLLIDSIRRKLLVLSDDTKVYPGHGPPTTIGIERAQNPFLTII